GAARPTIGCSRPSQQRHSASGRFAGEPVKSRSCRSIPINPGLAVLYNSHLMPMTTTRPAEPSWRERARTSVMLATLAGIGVSVLQLSSVRVFSQTSRGGLAQTLTPDDVAA